MNVLAFGGGTDSTAILCGWLERGYQTIDPIDLILFADTGGERPWTYEHIDRMQLWLELNGFPPITITRKGGNGQTLEENCLSQRMLPSLAYGFKSCSQKFKIEPQDKFCNNHPPLRAWWEKKRGQPVKRKVNKLIGYEFAEKHRWAKARLEDDKYSYEFPLVQWEWSRAECVAAIKRHGIPPPGKSSCFFCPANKKNEIDHLKQVYPVLFHRAIAMEDNARPNLRTVKGLGRSFSWRDYAVAPDEEVAACMYCVD